jgi:hypothetical protein
MSKRILQINFKYDMTAAEYEEAVAPLADPISKANGLLWKVWIINEEENEAGGIYLFKDAASVNAYMNSEIVAGIVSHPKLSDISAKHFDAMEDVSAVTRAPLHMGTTA